MQQVRTRRLGFCSVRVRDRGQVMDKVVWGNTAVCRGQTGALVQDLRQGQGRATSSAEVNITMRDTTIAPGQAAAVAPGTPREGHVPANPM